MPTWTPIPIATATPIKAIPISPSPNPIPTNAHVTETRSETPSGVPTKNLSTTPETSSLPTEDLFRYSKLELLARLPDLTSLAENLGMPVSRGQDGDHTSLDFGLEDLFLDPIVIRKPEPFLLGLAFVGQATSSREQLLANDLIERPDEYLQTIASGLVKGFQKSTQSADILELITIEAPVNEFQTAAARARVSSGSDVYVASLLVAEHEKVLALILQIARVEKVDDLLDAVELARSILLTEVPRG